MDLQRAFVGLAFLLVTLLFSHSTATALWSNSRIWKRQAGGPTVFAHAIAYSNGTIPKGDLELNNQALTTFNNGFFTAKAHTSNQAKGPNAVIYSYVNSNVNASAYQSGTTIVGNAYGQSQGTAMNGKLTNNDFGKLFTNAFGFNALGSSHIRGSGSNITLASLAESQMNSLYRSSSRQKPGNQAELQNKAQASASSSSAGSAQVGTVTLNNTASATFQCTNAKHCRSYGTTTPKPISSAQGGPQINAFANSIGSASGSFAVLQSVASASGTFRPFTTTNYTGTGTAGTDGQTPDGTAVSNQTGNHGSRPFTSAFGNGISFISLSGKQPVLQGNAFGAVFPMNKDTRVASSPAVIRKRVENRVRQAERTPRVQVKSASVPEQGRRVRVRQGAPAA